MTDFARLLLAADWREERIGDRIDATTAISTTHALVAERKRLSAFARYCRLAQEFDRRAGR